VPLIAAYGSPSAPRDRRTHNLAEVRGWSGGPCTAVLTHLRVPSRSGCRTYGAVVVGALALPS
jgi:hypothetical protein